jgi:hypothetical protein
MHCPTYDGLWIFQSLLRPGKVGAIFVMVLDHLSKLTSVSASASASAYSTAMSNSPLSIEIISEGVRNYTSGVTPKGEQLR